LTKAKVVTADAEVQQLEEKVRAVVENGKRVGAKVDALVELMQQGLRRDGGGATS
jgi:glutamine synthetase adenylyltransferase